MSNDNINISIEDYGIQVDLGNQDIEVSIDGAGAKSGATEWADVLNKPDSSVENIDDAVDKKHIQNTDTILDEGGPNEKTAEQLVVSSLDGDWKKVIEIQYNTLTQKLKFKYEE